MPMTPEEYRRYAPNRAAATIGTSADDIWNLYRAAQRGHWWLDPAARPVQCACGWAGSSSGGISEHFAEVLAAQ